MSCKFINESIKPNTPVSLVNWICFVNHHHYGHLSHDDTVKRFQRQPDSVINQYIDFNKMEELIQEEKRKKEERDREIELLRNKPVSREDVLRNLCGDELYNLLYKNI